MNKHRPEVPTILWGQFCPNDNLPQLSRKVSFEVSLTSKIFETNFATKSDLVAKLAAKLVAKLKIIYVQTARIFDTNLAAKLVAKLVARLNDL